MHSQVLLQKLASTNRFHLNRFNQICGWDLHAVLLFDDLLLVQTARGVVHMYQFSAFITEQVRCGTGNDFALKTGRVLDAFLTITSFYDELQ
jgi:hypothetical protein